MISFQQVGKRYTDWRGREVRALSDFSLELREGEVFGLAGPNGAGKSTLISLLLGFLRPSEGAVRIAGEDPRRYVEVNGVGYLSELIYIPGGWQVISALRRYAVLAGVPRREVRTRTEQVVEQLGLEEHRHKWVRQLSKGNLQRLGIAQTLLCDERVVVLDEPTHGLDPVWTLRFRDLVEGLKRADRTILIASHNLDELARLADRVGILDHGRLQRVVDVRGSERAAAPDSPYRLLVRGDDTGARVLARFPGAIVLSRGEFELPVAPLEEINAGVAGLIGDGVVVSGLQPIRTELEQQFREAVGRRATDR